MRRASLFAAPLLFLPVASPVAAESPRADRGAIVASVSPELLASSPGALEAPLVFAQTLGIPRVITWNCTTGVCGITWGSTAQITSTQAFVTYSSNGTSLLLNAPDTGRVTFAFGLTTSLTIADDGTDAEIIIPGGSTLDITDGSNNLVQIVDDGTTGHLQGSVLDMRNAGSTEFIGWNSSGVNSYTASVADGPTAIAHKFYANVDFTTAGALIAAFGDAASATPSQKFAIDLNGDFVIPNASTLSVTDGTNTFLNVTDAGTTGRLGVNTSPTYLVHALDAIATTGSPADLGIVVEDSQGTPRRGGFMFGGSNDFVVGAVSNHAVNLISNSGSGAGCVNLGASGAPALTYSTGVGGNCAVSGTGVAWQIDQASSLVKERTRAASGQTGTLTEWLDSSGNVDLAVDINGDFTVGHASLLFTDGTNTLVTISDNGTTGSVTATAGFTGTSFEINDSNVRITETGTNDFAITSDGAVSGTFSGGATATLVLSGQGVLQIGDSNVSISEQGTNDLLVIADGTSIITFSAPGAVPTWNLASSTNVQVASTLVLTLTGTLQTITGSALIDGAADTVQLTVQGNATQTSLLFVAENSAGADQFVVSNAGDTTITGDLTLNGGSNALLFGDTNVKIEETGTNDMTLTADGAGVLTLSSTGLNITGTIDGNSALIVTGNISSRGGGAAFGGVTGVKTTTYTATQADWLIPVSINGGSWTLTLPAASTAKGETLHVKCTDVHASNLLTVARAGADTITTQTATGATSLTMCAAATYSYLEVISDGTSVWYVTGFSL